MRTRQLTNEIGICPYCRSTRIRLRRQKHRHFLWRCRSCRRKFPSPALRNIQLSPGVASVSRGSHVLARDIPRMERSRRISGGRGTARIRRRRKRFPVFWLLLLVALAAGLYWLAERQDLDWSSLPGPVGLKRSGITNRYSGQATRSPGRREQCPTHCRIRNGGARLRGTRELLLILRRRPSRIQARDTAKRSSTCCS